MTYNSKGIFISKSSAYAVGHPDKVLTWADAEKTIRARIDAGRYLTAEEQTAYAGWQKERAESLLYSQGISTRDIQKTMQEMYGIDVNDSRVSKITDKILPMIREWKERPLQNVYAMMILDAVHYNVRENGIVTKKAAYVAIGTDLDGKKDVLGIWLGASESAKYWLSGSQWLEKPGSAGLY